jgi:hypothetical protein
MDQTETITLIDTIYGTVIKTGNSVALFRNRIFDDGVGGAIVGPDDDVRRDGFSNEIPDVLMREEREAMETWLEKRKAEDLGFGSVIPIGRLLGSVWELASMTETCDVRLAESGAVAIGYGPGGPEAIRAVQVYVEDLQAALERLAGTYDSPKVYVTVLPKHVVLVPDVEGTPCVAFVEAAS